MRQVGFLSSVDAAEQFADYLRANGIACSVDQGPNGYRVWVQDDDLVPAAREELPRFLAEPNHERYRNAGRLAQIRLQQDQARARAARDLQVDVASRWNRPLTQEIPVTIGLVAISVVVALLTGLRPNFADPRINQLFFSSDGSFQPILKGEFWRVITPIFLHFTLMHIVFNMMMTYQLGMAIEQMRGSLRLLLMVIVIAAFSNAAQFWFGGERFFGHWVGNPHFGGMSGVAYGLFGYVWIKGRLDPDSGFDLPQQTVVMMLVWYMLCVLEVIPHVANWCHGVGLITGVAIAAFGTWVQPFIRRN